MKIISILVFLAGVALATPVPVPAAITDDMAVKGAIEARTPQVCVCSGGTYCCFFNGQSSCAGSC